MRNNKIDRVVVNDNSWRSINPVGEDDVVLNYPEHTALVVKET
jgi:hypothetical protein